MPRRRTWCARRAGHGGDCRSPEALAEWARRTARRERVVRPQDKARWALTYKLNRYNLTQEDFDRMLEAQGHACAMCHEPFGDKQICIDHDHACCPDEKRSCGRCRRGLLCLRCNTALGYIERYTGLARAYLDSLPALVGSQPTT